MQYIEQISERNIKTWLCSAPIKMDSNYDILVRDLVIIDTIAFLYTPFQNILDQLKEESYLDLRSTSKIEDEDFIARYKYYLIIAKNDQYTDAMVAAWEFIIRSLLENIFDDRAVFYLLSLYVKLDIVNTDVRNLFLLQNDK
jgi:hypothetical protein